MPIKTGSEIVWESLIAEKVPVVFGYPGGAVLPMYDALSKYTKKIHHVLTRHEQGAAFAAQGYARATGKVGVCVATSGPGATNLITGIADAMMDSVPMVAITGQVTSSLLGTDAFQESDITGITLPITKHNYLITNAAELPQAIKEAFYLARTGRPGPVHIDIAKDAQIGTTEYDYKKVTVNLPGYRIFDEAKMSEVVAAATLIRTAKKPVIIAGHGVILSGATRELLQFAAKTDAAIVTTLLGNSVIPFGSKNYLGMLGMHGLAAANYAVAHADLIIGVGIRFDDRITGKVADFAKNARVIHIDRDPAEINKIIHADAPIVADARSALTLLNTCIEKTKCTDWHAEVAAYNARVVPTLKARQFKKTKAIKAFEVIHAINNVAPDALIVTDVGQHQMWTAMNFRFTTPGQLLTSGGLGTMGFGLPTAIGAKFGAPKKSVWCVAGDGGIQMNIQELGTILQERLPVKIAILNNSYLGMVRQWQDLFYSKNYSAVEMINPDFVKLAESYSIPAWRVKKPSEALKIMRKAESAKGPALVEFVIEAEENVFPMVPPGETLKNTRIN